MNTKLLMTCSALYMAVLGILLTFLPHEILFYLTSASGTILDALVMQILGALYFAFGMINWTARANLIGGIYGRPIAIGNLVHFIVGALALIKGYSTGNGIMLLTMTLIYAVFAILYGIVFFTHPLAKQ